MNAKGPVFKYGDNIDTDVIIPARYLNTPDAKELAAHCMEDIDAQFKNSVRPGDVMAAGWNFGCGSSREHAPIAIKASGVSCVVAKSFARIFYRNAINTGLPIVVSDIPVKAGDQVSVDLTAGSIENLTTGEKRSFAPFPAFLQGIIEMGGLMSAMKAGAL